MLAIQDKGSASVCYLCFGFLFFSKLLAHRNKTFLYFNNMKPTHEENWTQIIQNL